MESASEGKPAILCIFSRFKSWNDIKDDNQRLANRPTVDIYKQELRLRRKTCTVRKQLKSWHA